MECWLKAKTYLLGNGYLISMVEDLVHLTRKCRSIVYQGADSYELQELKNMNYEIRRAYGNYSTAVRYLGKEFHFQKTVDLAYNALTVISTAIKEKTPREEHVSRKDKRKAKAKLNRSYGRCKNR